MISSSEENFVGLQAFTAEYPSAGVHELVSAIAREQPHACAIRFADQQLSYSELDRASTRLAQTLRQQGAQANTLVALLVDRSPALLVALLAILKSGAGYVPLDPAYPAKRLQSMLALSGAVILVTEAALQGKLQLDAATTCFLLDEWQAQPELEVLPVVTSVTTAEDTAYVIFTSGSTGAPKGVEIKHGALVNLLWSLKKSPGFGSDDIMLAVTSISFDIAVSELLLPLVVGGQIEMLTGDQARDPARIMAKLQAVRISVAQATPVTWRMLISAGWSGTAGLRIWCGGEEMTSSLANELMSRSTEVWSMYGPTETTVWSAACRVTPALTGTRTIPLGSPLANTSLYVLDEARRPVAPGTAGELYIGGDGLAKGYWQRPDLTEQSFPSVNLGDERTLRLYKTGDRVLPHADGRLEFLGRLDRQVKLRGYRIELGEIEHAISNYPGVKEVVVTRVEDAERGDYLAAYLVPAQDTVIDPAELRQYAAQAIPSFMVPSAVCMLDRLPVTPNGKIDRKLLPVPAHIERTPAFVQKPAHHDLESELSQHWRETFRLPSIGRDDDFFAIGGDSLLATQLVTRLAKIYGRRCSVASLLQSPTIARFAAFLSGESVATHVVLQHGSAKKQFKKIFWMDNPDRLHRLAGLLGDQPFYSMLLSTEELVKEAPRYPMERLAARMVSLILEHQSEGQYCIGGFCQNALLAYEVSQQLQARGREVPLLIMIDPEDASSKRKRRSPLQTAQRRLERERFHLVTMIRQPLSEWIPYLQRRIAGVRFVLEERKWHRIAREGARTSERVEALAQALFVSRLTYEPRPYRGRVLFIEPTLRPISDEQDTVREWQSLAPQGEWRYVLGDHLGLFAAPGVHILSQEVQRALAESLP